MDCKLQRPARYSPPPPNHRQSAGVPCWGRARALAFSGGFSCVSITVASCSGLSQLLAGPCHYPTAGHQQSTIPLLNTLLLYASPAVRPTNHQQSTIPLLNTLLLYALPECSATCTALASSCGPCGPASTPSPARIRHASSYGSCRATQSGHHCRVRCVPAWPRCAAAAAQVKNRD